MALPPAARVASGSWPKSGSRSARSAGASPRHAASHSRGSLRVGRPPPGLPVVPRLAGHRAALARVGEGVARLRGHGEARVGVEPEAQLGGGDLLGPERGAVRLGRAGLGRRRPADDRAHAHERRAVLLGPRRENRRLERVDVVGVVDRQRVPAVGREAGLDVLGREGEVGGPVDRDPVVVVEVDEPPQAEVPGQRGGLGADALHQVAVGAEREDVVVADVARRSGRAGSARPWPCPRRWRIPAPAARSSSRCRRTSARGARACASPTGGSARARPAGGRSRPGAGRSTGASTRGRPRARSGRGRASRGPTGRASSPVRRARRRRAPWPAAARDGRSWPARTASMLSPRIVVMAAVASSSRATSTLSTALTSSRSRVRAGGRFASPRPPGRRPRAR